MRLRLDANIIIRCILGVKTSSLLHKYQDTVHFVTPDECLSDAKKYLPIIVARKKINLGLIEEGFSFIEKIVQVIPAPFYGLHEEEAKQRIGKRDLDDWPIVATALLFNCPIWTEDRDFFGSGMPIWTSDRIHLYFESDER